MKIFVTGACGFIGSHLAERLVRDGHTVTAMAMYQARDTYGWLDDTDLDMRKVRGDVRDTEWLSRHIRGQDVVYHLAALGSVPYSIKAPRSMYDTNIGGTLNVLEACRRHCVKMVGVSTSEVYGSAQKVPMGLDHPVCPQSPYAASKAAADNFMWAYMHLASSEGWPEPVTLRLFNTYGPRQSQRAVIPVIIRQCLGENHEIRLGNNTIRDITYVSDMVEALVTARFQDGGECQAASGEGHTVAGIISEIQRICDTKKPVIFHDNERTRSSDTEVDRLVGEPDLPNWKPERTLQMGLADTVDWWRDRPLKDMGYMI